MKSPRKPKRMKSPARRDAILAAVTPVFAAKGLHGATSSELAAAAGVSEALLYRHFTTKTGLYQAVGKQNAAARPLRPDMARLLAMPPSTARLVMGVHYLIDHLVQDAADQMPRLFAQSLLGDGAFARQVQVQFSADLLPFFQASIAAAGKAGDLRKDSDANADLAVWLVHHFAMGLTLLSLPSAPLTGPGASREAVVAEAVRFALRGLGLRATAIRKYYDAKG